MKLYHFTSVNSFLRIWSNQSLKFAEAKNVNDILEASIGVSTPIHSGMRINKVNSFHKVLSEYKQISFSKSGGLNSGCFSTMMWSHYGDKGNGICLEIESDLLNLPEPPIVFEGDIQYVDYYPAFKYLPMECNTKKEMYEYVERNPISYFFTKTKDWEGESEYRIISRKRSFLCIKDALTRVIIYRWNMPDYDVLDSIIPKGFPFDVIDWRVGLHPNENAPRLKDVRSFKKMISNNSNPYRAKMIEKQVAELLKPFH